MKTSEQINELATALAKAQGVMGGATKNAKNPHLNSHYANLASVIDASREALTANGLSIIQTPSTQGGQVRVTTRLAHSSGQWVEETLESPAFKGRGINDLQAMGTAISYLRRYMWQAIIGQPTEDDDGATSLPQRKAERAHSRAHEPAESPPSAYSNESIPHDPSFAKDRTRFCAALGQLGLKYDEVANDLEALDWGRPSSWTQADRDQLLSDLPKGKPCDDAGVPFFPIEADK